MHQHINITLIACSVLYLHNDPSIAYSWSIVNIRTINLCWTYVAYSATLNYLQQKETYNFNQTYPHQKNFCKTQTTIGKY